MSPALTTFQTNLQIHEDKRNTITQRGQVKEGTEIYLSNKEVFQIGDILEISPHVESADSGPVAGDVAEKPLMFGQSHATSAKTDSNLVPRQSLVVVL